MPTTVAQATVPANGASNAADFQPETRNPQSAPTQLFNQPEGVQSGTQSDLLDNNRATIQVPNNPAPARPAQPADSANIWPWLLPVLAVVALALYWWRRRPVAAPPEELPDMAVPAVVTEEPRPAVKPGPPKPKKPVPKRSKSRRKKRARR